jgi:hypothetical protein
MYLLYDMGRYSVRVNEATLRLEIERGKDPIGYEKAVEHATRSARADSESFLRHRSFRREGTGIGQAPDKTHLHHFTDEGDARKVP